MRPDRRACRLSLLRLWLAACLGLGAAALFAAESKSGDQPQADAPFSDASIQFDFANGLLRRRLYAEAAEEYEAFLRKFPDDPRAPQATLWRAEALFQQDRFAEAARGFYDFITKQPAAEKRHFARLRYGCALFALGKLADAVAVLEPLAKEEAAEADLRQTAWLYLGFCRQRQRDYAGALEALAKAETGSRGAEALFARGEVLAEMGAHAEAAEVFGRFAAQHPEADRAIAALLRQGDELRLAGKFEEAAQSLMALAEKTRENPQALAQAQYSLAWVRYSQKDYAAAATLAQQAAAQPSLVDDAQYLLGLVALAQNRWAEAIAAFSQVKRGAFAEDASLKIAWAHLLAEEPSKALAAAAEHRRRFPGAEGEIDLVEGKALMARQEWKEAAAAFSRARASKSARAQQAAYDLAVCQEQLGNWEAAAEAYKFVVENFRHDPLLLPALIGLGRAFMKQEKYEAAIPLYVRLAAEEGATAAVKEHALAQQAACYYHLKQYANMRKAYETLLADFPQAQVAAEALYWLAWHDAVEKRFGRAAAQYQALLDRFPEHPLAPKARYRRAACLYQEGSSDEAAAALLEILQRYPEIAVDEREMLWLGQYLRQQKRFAEADAVYEALLAKQPEQKVRVLALYQQAESRREQGKWQEALQKYQRLLAEKDSGIENMARYGAAICLREIGDIAAARATLKAIDVAVEDPLALRCLFEQGLLDLAEKNYAAAAAALMRVGLLPSEDRDLTASALLRAGEACLAAGDRRKAEVCFSELAGASAESFGKRYPDHPLVAEGKRRLEELRAAAPPRSPAPPGEER
ncbi:MAG: tetratricopeptide repeat protein [Planctomycetota bacterium]|nr:tetratricopeptide repeat protein [Planctomycetota bacterium]